MTATAEAIADIPRFLEMSATDARSVRTEARLKELDSFTVEMLRSWGASEADHEAWAVTVQANRTRIMEAAKAAEKKGGRK